MKKKSCAKKQISILLCLVLVMIMTVSALSFVASATDAIEVIGEMEKDVDGGNGIASTFEAYKIQDTKRTKDDYVGDFQYTVYFDRGENAAKTVIPGYNGTTIAIYVINTETERVGTHTNRKIISSMLERGYVVVVLDYLSNPNARGMSLDISSAQFNMDLKDGKYFDKTTEIGAAVFEQSGSYHERFLVPSGYDLSVNNVFWEIDKHSMEGTLDKIVENWNSDFRTAKAEKIVKWVRTDGSRKTTGTVDGASAVWYADAAGKTVDAENGQYTKVKYTVAESITDCVNPDGTPLEMNLYTNVIYPTSPKEPVPVLAKASSNGDLTLTPINSAKPYFTEYLFNGYAMAVYDYLWQPMAQNASFGYYDGSQGNTKDHMNYGLMMYNDKLVNTAAMRFLRHLSANGGDTYNFDLNRFGVNGYSKGGWFTFIGEKIVQSPLANGTYATQDEKEKAIDAAISALMSDRYYSNQSGKTRYQKNASAVEADVYTGEYIIDAGEMQPWLTYPDGSEIISGCQAVYAGVGGQVDDVTAGHVPIFEVANLKDDYSAAYNSANHFINLIKNLDIAGYYFDTPLGHSVANGPDLNYGVDTFGAMVKFFNYYLKNTPASVLYTEPRTDERNVSVTDKITIKFMGSISEEEIAKVTVSSESGLVSGSWSAAVGKTEWTFTPDELIGGTEYTVTVPAGVVGDNGTPIAEGYSYTFVTEYDNNSKLSSNGGYYTFVAPTLTNGNSFAFRFFADGINTAELYAVNAEGDTDGELLGKVNVKGAANYEIDVTDYILANAGKEVTLLLKEGRATVSESVINDSLSNELSANVSKNSKVTLTEKSAVGDRVALEAVVSSYTTNGVSKYYLAETKAFTYNNVTGGYVITEDDVGRTYTFSIDIYDTISRTVSLKTKTMTKKATGTLDYNRVYINVNTKAGEWTTVEFTYTVYETVHGEISNDVIQALDVFVAADGNAASPIYFSNLKVTEVLTPLDVDNACIAEKDNGLGKYTAPSSDKAFALYNGDTLVSEHDTLNDAISTYVSGYSITLQRDYHLTDADLTDAMSDFESVMLNLGEYTVYCDNTAYSLFHIKADNTYKSTITVNGGKILLGKTALVSYEDSTSAGNGKNVNINFQNTYIGFNNNAYTTAIVSNGTGVSGVSINVNLSLDNCVLDLPEESRARSNSVVFPASATEGLEITYTLAGGEIKLSATRWIKLADGTQNLKFVPNSFGELTRLITPSYISWEIEDTFYTSNGYANFISGAAQNGYITRTLVIPDNSTKYGIIPEEYMDSEKYPFIVFDGEGNFVGGYSQFLGTSSSSSTAAIIKLKNMHQSNTWDSELGIHTGRSAVILLRRDYEYVSGEKYDNWSQISGECTIDLGGHSITQHTGESGRLSLFNFESKAYTNSGKWSYYYPTTINVVNGKLYTYDKTFFTLKANQSDYASAQQYVSDKKVTFNFEEVTFGLTEGASVSEMMITCQSASNLSRFVEPAPFDINYTNCTFDLSVKSTAESFTIFDAGTDSDKWIKATLKVAGGKIISSDPASIDIYSSNGNYGSSIEFVKNENGEYITLEAPIDAEENNEAIPTDSGVKFFVKTGESNGNSIYTLGESALKTIYGSIPSSEIGTESEKPFALFVPDSTSDTKYSYVEVFETWADVAAKADDVSGSVIYLRADASWSAGAADTTFAGNFGTVTVDLNGKTLTRIKGYLVNSYFRNTTAQNSKLIFKNGTIVKSSQCTSTYGMFCINYSTSNRAVATFDMTFDNVNLINETTSNFLFMLWENGYSNNSTKGTKSTVTFNNCTIDSNGATIFVLRKAGSNYNKTDIDVVVNGGTIISDKAITTSNLYDKNDDDSVKFGKYNGEYTKIVLPTTEAYPDYSVVFEGASGERLSYVATETAGTYVLGADEKTTYDYIPARYSISDYPFAVFTLSSSSDTEYEFASAYSLWKDAAAIADDASGSVIYLRADASWSEGAADTTFAGNFGTVTVDLNGKTLTRIKGYLVNPYFKNTTAQNNKLIFKNGTIVKSSQCTSTNGMICINYSTSNRAVATFDMTFDNVNLINETTSNFLFALWENGYTNSSTKGTKSTVTFNNCTIDSNGACVFVLRPTGNTGRNRSDFDIVINGGKMTFKKTLTDAILYNKNSDDTIEFGKYNGSYTEFVFPANASMPTVSINDGELIFVKAADSETATIYTLMPTDVKKFTPKTSITLSNALIYNVYIPVNTALKSFALNGVSYTDLAALTDIVTIDANNCYHFAIELPSAEAAKDIILEALITVDGKDYNGKWTMSIPKYAMKVLSNGADVEKTLAKDVLAYVKAAYNYFTEFNTAEEIARVNTLIDSIIGDYNAAPVSSGETNAVSPVTSVTLNLDSKPSIRFYVTDTTIEFFANGRKLDTVTGTDETYGAYVELDVYAYALCETISYGEGGSYHISSFVNGSVGTEYEMLVKAFVKYVESAAAYRNYVVNN